MKFRDYSDPAIFASPKNIKQISRYKYQLSGEGGEGGSTDVSYLCHGEEGPKMYLNRHKLILECPFGFYPSQFQFN